MKVFLSNKTPESIKRLYRNRVRNVPVKISLGKKYWAIRDYIESKDFLSKAELEVLQLQKIKEMVAYAYTNVPGYYQIYSEARLSAEDIRSLDDFTNFPIVTKELIRDNLKDFTSKNLGLFNKEYAATGGSSGIPFAFFRSRLNNYSEPAYIHSGWVRSGWEVDNLSVVLRGAYIGSKEDFHYFNPSTKELALSTYYLTTETYKNYKEKVLSDDFRYLQAYPSSASILADLIIENGDHGDFPFEIIFLGSENIYDFQLKKIKEAFPKSKINHWYGHSEQAILAQVCEFSDIYHVSPTYGYTEIIDSNFNEVKQGTSGQLLGTSFYNFATPFIRYLTDDIGVKGGDGCDKCGRQHLLISNLEGRKQEIIISKSGRYIPMAAINMHSNVYSNVKQFQFFQEKAGVVTLNIIPKIKFETNDQVKIMKAIQEKLGDGFDLTVKLVSEIEKTTQGKYRFLVQKLNLTYGD